MPLQRLRRSQLRVLRLRVPQVHRLEDVDLPGPVPGLPVEPADPAGLEKLNRELGIAPHSSRLLKALGGG